MDKPVEIPKNFTVSWMPLNMSMLDRETQRQRDWDWLLSQV